MRLHIAAAALAVATLVAGCGFVPKKPPLPDAGNRVPVNLTAPFPSPAMPAPQPIAPANGQSVGTAQRAEPIAAPVTTEAAPAPGTQIQPAPTPSEPSEPPGPTGVTPPAPATKPIGVWPVMLAFSPQDSLQARAQEWQTHELAMQRKAETTPASPVTPAAPPTATKTPAPEVPPEPAVTIPIDSPVASLAVTEDVVMVDVAHTSRVAQAPDSATTSTNTTPTDASESSTNKEPAVPDGQPRTEEKAGPETTEASEAPAAPNVPNAPEAPNVTPATTTWKAGQSSTLSDLVREWASQEGWTVRWDSSIDFGIDAAFKIEAGSFLDAANTLFKAYRDAGCEFGLAAYSNQVLLVTTPRICTP